MSKVLVIGGVSYDSIIYLDELPRGEAGSYFSKSSFNAIGGTGAGKSLNLTALGFETTFHAFLGNDEAGSKVREFFKNKENISFIAEEDKEGTLQFTNLIDDNGNRMSIFSRYNTFDPDFDLSKLQMLITENDYVILNIMNYARYLIPFIKSIGKKIWCDIHDYEIGNEYYDDFIDNADYLFMSSEKMKDYQGFMEKMIDKGKQFVVCTHGKEGSTLMNKEKELISEPAILSYEKKDINGAGDSFFSGFLYAFDRGKSLRECMRYATISGGMCVTSKELYAQNLSALNIEGEYLKHYRGAL